MASRRTRRRGPWLRISKDRLQSLLRAIAALGFDPRSRTSLSLPDPSTKPTKKTTAGAPEVKPIRHSEMVEKLRAQGLL